MTHESGMDLPALVRAMLEPDFYPHGPAAVQLVQTHISFVFLAGDAVYKVKKPVRFSFLDFSTPGRRRHFCHEEVRLNRRLAPDVYRGVRGIRERGGRFELCDDAAPDAVDYAVVMNRLPDERSLQALVAADRIDRGVIESVAERLVRFHAAARSDDEVRACGSPERVLAVLEDNFANVRAFRGLTVDPAVDDEIQGFARGFLAGHGELLQRRQREGRIREGHGDLRMDHVYALPEIVVVDCVEFDPRFRCCDVASDIAFLAMDFTFAGRSDLARALVESYAARAVDSDLARLVRFYSCYRAYVRGKVESLRGAEPEVGVEERAASLERARRFFDLALRCARDARPLLLVIGGLSGTGKSTVAAALGQRRRFVRLNSDTIRKQLAGVAPTARPGAELYTPEMSRRTYAELLRRAREEIAAGRDVIADATFPLRAGRDEARRIAERAGAAHLLVWCECAEHVVRERLERRSRAGTDASDADWTVYVEQRQRFEPVRPDEGALVVDTGRPLDAVVETILEGVAASRY